MGPDTVVILGIGFECPAQMRLAQDNDAVHTFSPDRSNQLFGIAVMPGRGWCSRLVSDAHGAQSTFDDGAIDPIPIADEVARGFVPRKASVNWRTIHSAVEFVVYVDPDEVSAV